MAITTTNPFLEGNFAPVREEHTVENLEVIGELPADMCGMFLRNGPNPQFPPRGLYHWFDGDGMIHGVHVAGGKASYRNRFVRTKIFKREREAGRCLRSGILEMGKEEGLTVEDENTANTSVVYHDGRLLALWEAGKPYRIVLPGLETAGPFDYDGDLFSPFTAHPKIDHETGEMMLFGYSLDKAPYVLYTVVSEDGELRTVPIDVPKPVMMHDFAITEDYTIFMDLPLTFDIERLSSGGSPFAFQTDRPSRFGILPRYGTSRNVRWFEAPACWIWHVFNAYEYGDEVVLTVCKMESTGFLDPGYFQRQESGQSSDVSHLHQWRFNLKTGQVREEVLDDTRIEFPRINDRLTGRQNRYGYAGREVKGARPMFDALIRYDLFGGNSQTHEFGPGRFGGEGVFVPRPGSSEEDDGWLVTFVFDTSEDRSEMIVLDAADLTSEPLARVVLPQRVPYGFHGTWVSHEELSRQRLV